MTPRDLEQRVRALCRGVIQHACDTDEAAAVELGTEARHLLDALKAEGGVSGIMLRAVTRLAREGEPT